MKLFMVFLIFPIFLFSQEQKFEETVIITAPAIVSEIEKDPLTGSKDVIGKEQIEEEFSEDIHSSLRKIPGLFMSRYNYLGSFGGADGGAIFIRGKGIGRPGAEIKFLIDGLPRFVGLWTHPLLDLYNVNSSESIEVYKSPQPAVYGNMSFGVINLVPEKSENDGFKGKGEFYYGEYSTKIGRIESSYKKDKFDFFFSGSIKESDGHREGASGEVDNFYSTFGINLSNSSSLRFSYDHSRGDTLDPGPIDSNYPFNPRFRVNDDFSWISFDKIFNKSSLKFKIYKEKGFIDWDQIDTKNQTPFSTRTSYINYGGVLNYKFFLWNGSDFEIGYSSEIYGGSAIEKKVSSVYSFDKTLISNRAFYLLFNQDFKNILFSLGTRYNISNPFEDELSYQGGLKYKIQKNFSLFYNGSKSFNLPGVWAIYFYERWNKGDLYKDLKAEKLNHNEAGFSFEFENLNLFITYYYDNGKDALKFIPPPPSPSFLNISEYKQKGIEVEGNAKISKKMSLFFSANFSSSEPENLPYSPEKTYLLGINFKPTENHFLSFDIQHLSSFYAYNPRYSSNSLKLSSFTLSNITYNFKFYNNLKFKLKVENIFDEKYSIRAGYPMPGRTFTGGFSFDF